MKNLIKIHPIDLVNKDTFSDYSLINLNQVTCIITKGNGCLIQLSDITEIECIESIDYFLYYLIEN